MKKIISILTHKLSPSLIFTVSYFSKNIKNEIYIHVDKKTEIEPFLFMARDNVFFISDRVDVSWGNISVVDATIKLLEAVKDVNYDSLSLISGDDIPACNELVFDEFLNQNLDKDFIHIQDERNGFVNPYDRVFKKYPSFVFKKEKNILVNFILKLNLLPYDARVKKYFTESGIKLFKGTQWFTFRKSTIVAMLDFINKNPHYYESFIHSFCPDEIFFQTIFVHLNLNKYHDKSKLNDCCRYIDWSSGPEYPKLLNRMDFYNIKNKGYFFARKVSDNITEDDMLYLVN